MWGQDPTEGTICGVVRPIEKHCQSLLRCRLQKINSGTTALLHRECEAAQPTRLIDVVLHCPRVKTSAPAMRPFVEIY